MDVVTIAERVVVPLVLGAVGGAIRSVAGYIAAKKDDPKKVSWNWGKALQSFGRGAVAGFVLSFTELGGVPGVWGMLTTVLGGLGGDVLAHDVGIKK